MCVNSCFVCVRVSTVFFSFFVQFLFLFYERFLCAVCVRNLFMFPLQAKDHAKMGIKEVKSRLKQKVLIQSPPHTHTQNIIIHNFCINILYMHAFLQELTENGYSEEPGSTHLPSTHSKDSLTWDQRQPITVHFGQVGVGNYNSFGNSKVSAKRIYIM